MFSFKILLPVINHGIGKPRTTDSLTSEGERIYKIYKINCIIYLLKIHIR